MADSAAKKLSDALQEVEIWALTGISHYTYIYRPAKDLADKLRSAKNSDPNMVDVVSKALVEMVKVKSSLPKVASGLDVQLKNLEKAKTEFEMAAKLKK